MQWVIGWDTQTRTYGSGQQWSWTASSIMNIYFALSKVRCVFLTTGGNQWRGFKGISSLRKTRYNFLTYILGQRFLRWSWTVSSIVGRFCHNNLWKQWSQILKRTLPEVGIDCCKLFSHRSWEIIHLGWGICRRRWILACNDNRNSSAS